MPDAIWANRFWNRGTEPAWHGLGVNSEEPISATEALTRVGTYTVRLEPLYALIEEGPRIAVPYANIIREPTKDDPFWRVFGAPVSVDYELIGPEDCCQIWDRAVPQPIETLGVLKDGQELFISTKLFSIDVAGDEVVMYLVWDNPMYSNNAGTGVVTGVRPVCANTLALGIAKAVTRMKVVHTSGAKARMQSWLHKTYCSAQAVVDEAKLMFNLMAKVKLGTEKTLGILKLIYEDPPKPQEEWVGLYGELTFEQFMANYEAKKVDIQMTRDTVLGLFGGDGIALGTQATEGTAFGLLNAVAEYEDNRRGPAASTAISVLVGERADMIRKAYKVLSAEVVGGV